MRNGANDSNSRISTHAPLAGRDDMISIKVAKNSSISTHAPLAGRDFQTTIYLLNNQISTHAPLAGRDFSLRNLKH